MWHLRTSITNHVKGVLPGAVPIPRLREQSCYICSNCSSLVADYHSISHSKKCPSVAFCSQTQSHHDIKVVPCSIPHQVTWHQGGALLYPTSSHMTSRWCLALSHIKSHDIKVVPCSIPHQVTWHQGGALLYPTSSHFALSSRHL